MEMSFKTNNINNNFSEPVEDFLPGIHFHDADKPETTSITVTTVCPSHREVSPQLPTKRVRGKSRKQIPAPSLECYPSREYPENDDSNAKRVRFASHEFLETTHAPPIIKVLDEEFIHELWWQSPELSQMKRNTRNLLIALIKKEPEAKQDWIGLDRFTQQRIEHKKRAVRLVLLAQHQQRTHNISNNIEAFLRAVSKRGSQWSRDFSHSIGQRLFREINTTQVNVTFDENMAGSTENATVSDSSSSLDSNIGLSKKRKEATETSEADASSPGCIREHKRVKQRLDFPLGVAS